MNKSKLLIFAVALLLIPASFSQEFDLYEPLSQIFFRLEKAEPLNLSLLFVAIPKLLGCLATPAASGLLIPPKTIGVLEAEFKLLPKTVLALPDDLVERIKQYVKTEEFKEIHNFLWHDDAFQWQDFIFFFYNHGFKNVDGVTGPERDIYELIKRVYGQFDACDNPDHISCDDIAPPTPQQLAAAKKNHSRSKRSVSQDPINWSEIFAEPCTSEVWEQIMKELIDSQALQWLHLINFISTEIKTNPAIHFLWAKFYEAEKGLAFREFRLLPSVVTLIEGIDNELKANKLFQLVIGILEGLTGIKFSELNINIISNIVSIFEYLVWRTHFPVPADIY